MLFVRCLEQRDPASLGMGVSQVSWFRLTIPERGFPVWDRRIPGITDAGCREEHAVDGRRDRRIDDGIHHAGIVEIGRGLIRFLPGHAALCCSEMQDEIGAFSLEERKDLMVVGEIALGAGWRQHSIQLATFKRVDDMSPEKTMTTGHQDSTALKIQYVICGGGIHDRMVTGYQ